jgi:exodeoxyribonuclease VII large subunit
MFDNANRGNTPAVWQIGALVHAIAEVLQARFNPVAVRGEISGFSKASSGHCYFTLKDETGQMRCAMFRRAAQLLDFQARDGLQVEVRGRLDVYGPRGDLQLIVESMVQAGAGALFEQFLRLKTKLQAEGLFDTDRKRAIPSAPRGIGIVTSLGAAALADVATALQRRVPHIPVVLVNASVQGAQAPADLMRALANLYRLTPGGWPEPGGAALSGSKAASQHWGQGSVPVDVILLVRGGGSIDDLAAFNDESLARCVANSPVPVISGVGHETDFTIVDFVADLRAPTPTAAAELAALPRSGWLDALKAQEGRLQTALQRTLEAQQQWLDGAASRLSRPSALAAHRRLKLEAQQQRLRFASLQILKQRNENLRRLSADFPLGIARLQQQCRIRLEHIALRLGGVDPHRVLQRGYAWVTDASGQVVTSSQQLAVDQDLHVRLRDGQADVTVTATEGR